MPSPYAEHVGHRDPVDVLRSSLDDYRALVPRIGPGAWARPWAPGKWTVAEIMLHVTQWELIFGVRVRCALAMPPFTLQAMSQDPLLAVESRAVDGPTAAAAFDGVRRLNLALASSLSPDDRRIVAHHPERGAIDVNDLLITLAGHGVHHLKQLQQTIG
jgi:DinB superfamily